MKQQLRLWLDKYEALTLRERLIIAALVAVVVIIAWNELLWQFQLANAQRFQSELSSLQTRIQAANKQIAALRLNAGQDPDRQEKRQKAELQQQRVRLDQQLKQKMHGLIEPVQMAHMLEAVLTRQTDLKLRRVQNLPPRPLLERKNNQGSDVGIYRHGLQIEFSGSYLSTLEYLKALKALPWDFYWDELTLEVERYPLSHIVIKVHTLSLQEGWIGV